MQVHVTLHTRVTEREFKRHVMAPAPRRKPPLGGFPYVMGSSVNIFVYSDESGVFDRVHNDLFVFAGLIILSSESKEDWSRRYSAAEKRIRATGKYGRDQELKASLVTNSEKLKLYKTLNGCYKFAVIIRQQKLLKTIFDSKKDKQRYLDYAYKIGIKRALEQLISLNVVNPDEVENMHFFVDEHSTATNGCYELKEALEREFKNGTYNYTWDKFFPPIFTSINTVNLEYCNSAKKILIRAADVVANRVFYLAKNGMLDTLSGSKVLLSQLPY